MKTAIAALALMLAATPAAAFDPMTPEQKADALPLQRELTACYFRETNKPYVTKEDVHNLIEAAVPVCAPIAIKLKSVLGTGRMEAFWLDFEMMIYEAHAGADDGGIDVDP